MVGVEHPWKLVKALSAGCPSAALIDDCAAKEPQCKRFRVGFGLPLGSLGPLAAQWSIRTDYTRDDGGCNQFPETGTLRVPWLPREKTAHAVFHNGAQSVPAATACLITL
jgi:hypothetical protein